jgi:prevent-host-death family protein
LEEAKGKADEQLTEEELEQHTADAMRAALEGTVYITKAAKPTHALVSIEEYDRLVRRNFSLIEAMVKSGGVADIEFECARSDDVPKPANFED